MHGGNSSNASCRPKIPAIYPSKSAIFAVFYNVYLFIQIILPKYIAMFVEPLMGNTGPGCCEHGYELLVSMKYEEFLRCLRDCWHLKRNAVWSDYLSLPRNFINKRKKNITKLIVVFPEIGLVRPGDEVTTVLRNTGKYLVKNSSPFPRRPGSWPTKLRRIHAV